MAGKRSANVLALPTTSDRTRTGYRAAEATVVAVPLAAEMAEKVSLPFTPMTIISTPAMSCSSSHRMVLAVCVCVCVCVRERV